MVALSEEFGNDLAILAFPSGEFGGQELGTDEEIQAFAASKAFPPPPRGIVMSKGLVCGSEARPVWKLLKEATSVGDPSWNFQGKFLVSKEGDIALPGQDIAASIAKLL